MTVQSPRPATDRPTGPIVVAGENLIDLLVRADGSVVATPGGGPYNVARTRRSRSSTPSAPAMRSAPAALAAWDGAYRSRDDLGDPVALIAAVRFAVEVGARTTTRAGAEPPRLAELRGVASGW